MLLCLLLEPLNLKLNSRRAESKQISFCPLQPSLASPKHYAAALCISFDHIKIFILKTLDWGKKATNVTMT